MSNEKRVVSISEEELLALRAKAAKTDKKEDTQRRNWTKRNLLIRKAILAGITATEAEIDMELKRIDGK